MGILSTWPSGNHAIAVSLAVVGLMNSFGFLHSMLWKSHALCDLIGAGGFVVSLFCTAFFNYQVWSLRHYLLVALVGCWSVRLTSFLFWRSRLPYHDTRFDDYFPSPESGWCSDPSRLVGLSIFWLFQVIWAVVVLVRFVGGGDAVKN